MPNTNVPVSDSPQVKESIQKGVTKTVKDILLSTEQSQVPNPPISMVNWFGPGILVPERGPEPELEIKNGMAEYFQWAKGSHESYKATYDMLLRDSNVL